VVGCELAPIRRAVPIRRIRGGLILCRVRGVGGTGQSLDTINGGEADRGRIFGSRSSRDVENQSTHRDDHICSFIVASV
jgi:hypothetical protein